MLWQYIFSNYFRARRLKKVCVQLFEGFSRAEICKNSFLTHFKHGENSDHTPQKNTKDTELQIAVDSVRHKPQRRRISELNLVLLSLNECSVAMNRCRNERRMVAENTYEMVFISFFSASGRARFSTLRKSDVLALMRV